ncbi:uncharacterized protein [Aegilops tauschii subsp. strangulata]|uniref:uncharacterized protein n=1 Tax=Aegilops tauschii subsp. strangulata TaxID=200361 RepID=UPI003CC8BE81
MVSWQKEVVGEIEGRLKKARKDLERCMRCPVSEEKIAEEARLRCVVNDLEEKKNTKEKQRSRVSWLKDGNRNTRYFMAFASARRKMNRVKELKKEDGSVVKEGEELTNYICSYFQDLFTSRTGNRLHELIDKVEPRITTPMHAVLDAEFTREEVKAALDHIGDLKAPGPDGMPSILYKKHWHFMGDRVVDEVLAVLNGGPIPEGWNETIVVLIPKVRTPSRIKDLRPISLCNVIYKLVSKVIANRLKIILPDIISDNQSAFVPGRLITDNVLIAYELSHFLLGRKKGKEDFAAVKADMSKAYDRVEWSFLEAMLDDSMLLLKASSEEVAALRGVLDLYEQCSGQCINTEKSAVMFSPNTLAETRELVKQTIHIQSENWNEKYLGLPVHVGKSKKKAFAYVKGSMAGKVYGWQERLIAKVGKETLVKAVAQAIPTFAMSCFYLTKSFCQELSSLMGKYWWSQQEKENTLHWISWEKLTRSKAQGGLAQFLPRIKLKEGYALPADLAFDPKPGVPLRSNPEGPIFFPNTHVLDAVAKDGISYSWRSLLHGLDLFKEGYIWRIGEGTQVRFWSDLWLPRPWSQKLEKNERDGNAGSSTGLPGNLDNCHDDSWKRLWKLPCPRNIQIGRRTGAHLFVKCKAVKEVWRDLSLEKERMELEREGRRDAGDVRGRGEENEEQRLGILPGLCTSRGCSREICVWIPPPNDKIKLNIDGSHMPDETHAGWGVVARDAAGTILGARAGRKEFVPDAFAAEVHAMADAVSFAADMGMLRVIFETDCQLLAEAMDLGKVDSSAYSAIIEDTKLQLKLWFSHHEIMFCKRHVNSVADELAKLGRLCDVNHSVEWESDVPANVAACLGDLPGHQ